MTTKSDWRPLAEMHEDHGPCVMMNIDDPGALGIGHVCDVSFAKDCREARWTHFVPVPPLTNEQAAELGAEMPGMLPTQVKDLMERIQKLERWAHAPVNFSEIYDRLEVLGKIVGAPTP